MTGSRAIVFDVNFLSLMHCIDETCDLLDYICECFEGYAVGDEQQLREMDYCKHVADEVAYQDATDEEVTKMVYSWASLSFERVKRDPADLKLLAYADRENGVLMSCDSGVLRLAHGMEVEHWCFKASVWEADKAMEGGIAAEPAYKTEIMEQDGRNPFFYRSCCTRCGVCDPPQNCPHGHVGTI